jgi:long-chain acyl-CoA synthetase
MIRYPNYVSIELTEHPEAPGHGAPGHGAPGHGGRTDGADRRTLGRTAAWLSKQVEIGLAAADLSLPQYRVLGLLDERSAISSDLAQQLAVRPATVTAVIDGLVARHLVERRGVAGDRRRVSHVLTEAGRRALDAADAAVDARLRTVADALDDPAGAEQAFDGLAVWRQAFLAYGDQQVGR